MKKILTVLALAASLVGLGACNPTGCVTHHTSDHCAGTWTR